MCKSVTEQLNLCYEVLFPYWKMSEQAILNYSCNCLLKFGVQNALG